MRREIRRIFFALIPLKKAACGAGRRPAQCIHVAYSTISGTMSAPQTV